MLETVIIKQLLFKQIMKVSSYLKSDRENRFYKIFRVKSISFDKFSLTIIVWTNGEKWTLRF